MEGKRHHCEEVEGLEEWKKCGEAFRGIAEVLCGRTSGKGASSRDRNQVWWMEEVAKAVGENNREDQGLGEATGCGVAAPLWAEEESSKESCG